ncbi:MAG TPA: S8 family serine peptidase [Pyrinomonadaceae bacterium]|nr:S8 family serine peptidase [Pyrinomonadaceae bacterium]
MIKTIFLSIVLVASVGAQSYAPDEILVKRVNGSVHHAVGTAVVEDLGDWQRVKLPPHLSVGSAISAYHRFKAFAQPNFYYHPLSTSNDPQFSGMYGLSEIAAPSAWDLSTGSSSIVVADIDTGTRYTHEDLSANMWQNPGETGLDANGLDKATNGIDDDSDGFVDDVYGADVRFNDGDPTDVDYGVSGEHGTHTAGIIGAVGNNGLGVVGVNWNVKIMSVKIFNNTVWDDTTSAMLVSAYRYVLMMKRRGVNIRVTNNSYGGCTEACGYDQATKDAIDALGNAGILNVFAAGNNNSNNEVTPFYTASYNSPSIVSVAASDSWDNRASFSDYGATSVDLAAPGVSILSTVPMGYAYLSGTSMAAPHVTGAIALLSAYRPNLSMESLKASILNSVDTVRAWRGIVKSNGRLNINKAMKRPTICTFTPSTPTSIGPQGGNGSFSVTVADNCDYSPTSTVPWITVTSGPLSGKGVVTYSVAAGSNRSGTIVFAGTTVTVTQR